MRRLLLTISALLALTAPAAHAQDLPQGNHEDTVQELGGVDIPGEVGQARLRSMDVGIAASALPTTWCGTATTTDNTVDATFSASLPQFKVIYAYPADRANRFADWQDALQLNLSLIEQFVSSQPGSARAPRFDMGTSCGPEYLDIQTVALPSVRSAYMQNMGAVETYVKTKVNPSPGGIRNYMIIADTMSSGGLNGVGELYEVGSIPADRPDAANIHNNGGLTSVMWTLDSGAPGTNPNGWWPEGLLHEMTHNMGGVQWTAPHTSQPAGGADYIYSHCWDGRDVMCYQDGPNPGHPYSTGVCAAIAGALPQTYDCNQDDYFSPAPQSGNYLATHWNVYDSVFMADCSTLPTNTCIDSQTAGVPFNTVKPAVSGTAEVGATLTATTGTWNPAGASYEYEWLRNGAVIAGATSPAYVTVTADKGLNLHARVTAVGTGGTRMKATSDPVGPIAGKPPVNTVAPGVTGSAVVGGTLSGTIGTWSPAGTSYAYQWQRFTTATIASDIAGATAATYKPTSADAGLKLWLQVTATNSDGVVKAWSAQVGPITSSAPANTVPPAITGQAKVGATLTGTTGTWNPAGGSYAYQWQRFTTATSAVDIAGATASTYKPTSADKNLKLQLRVTASGGDTSVKASSAQFGPIVANPPVSTVAPAVSGSAVVGATLSGTIGTWSPAGRSYAYQWQRFTTATSAVDIAGATGSRYRLTTADKNLKVSLRVTATNGDGSTNAWSKQTGTTAPVSASATIAAGSSSTLKTAGGASVASATVSGGTAKASAARVKASGLTVTVRRKPKARGKLNVIVCPTGAKPRPCAAAKTLGKRPVKVKLGVSSQSVRVILSH